MTTSLINGIAERSHHLRPGHHPQQRPYAIADPHHHAQTVTPAGGDRFWMAEMEALCRHFAPTLDVMQNGFSR